MESESDPLTCRPVDLFEKEPLKGKWEVNLHTPTKFGADPSKDLGGNREHTNKRCSNYSMIFRKGTIKQIIVQTKAKSIAIPALITKLLHNG